MLKRNRRHGTQYTALAKVFAIIGVLLVLGAYFAGVVTTVREIRAYRGFRL